MSTRRKTPELVEARLTIEEMKEAIPKIDRRIAELDAFDVESVSDRRDPRIVSLENKLDALLVSMFGADTVEYKRYRHDATRIDTAGISMMGTPIEEVRDGLNRGVAIAKAQLEAIKGGFLEEFEDSGGTPTGRALRAYSGLDLHPAIERAAGSLFRDGHYANAIEDAVKALNNLVRLNSGAEDRDGSSLMEYVFSPANPTSAVRWEFEESWRLLQRQVSGIA